MTPADFGDARLRGTEHRLAIGGPSSPSSKIQFRWALEDLYQRC